MTEEKFDGNGKIEENAFIPTEEGSARLESLDAKSDSRKLKKASTQNTESLRGAPWSKEPSLKFMCDEVGVNMDSLIGGIEQNKSDTEMAKELGVSAKTVKALKEHFMTHGVGSIEGQD